MDNEELEDLTASNESSDDSSEQDEGQEEGTPSNSNGKSNWKKMASALKTERKEKEALAERLAAVENYLLQNSPSTQEEWGNSETDFRLFVVETPEAKEYKEEIKQALIDYPWISLEKAFLYAKATKPQPSKSVNSFDFNWKQKPKDFKSLTDEEAVEKLSPSEYLKYSREVLGMKL